MKAQVEKVQHLMHDPMRIQKKHPTIHKWSKLIMYVGLIALIACVILYLIMSLLSDRHTKLGKYRKQMKRWMKGGTASNFSDIRMGVMVMPSEQKMMNMDIMEWRNYDHIENKKMNKKYNYSQSYHILEDTTNLFPILNMNEDHIPIGNSQTFCIHLFWVPKSDIESIFASRRNVTGFSECINFADPSFRWHPNDPSHGVDIKPWVQHDFQMTCKSREDCTNQCLKRGGVFKNSKKNGNRCYSYELVREICMEIDLDNDGNWHYQKGCFAKGSAARYVKAVVNQEYDFERLTIQVRHSKDPYTVATNLTGDLNFGIDIDWLYDICTICFWVAVVCGILCLIGFYFGTQLEPKAKSFDDRYFAKGHRQPADKKPSFYDVIELAKQEKAAAEASKQTQHASPDFFASVKQAKEQKERENYYAAHQN